MSIKDRQQALLQIGQHNPRRSQNSSKGSGAPPARSLACPHGISTNKKSLYSSARARIDTRGLLSRVSVRGTLTDAHDESTRTQIKGPRLDAPRSHAQLSMPPRRTHSYRRPEPRTRKERRANRLGLERRLPSNTETGSYELKGLERKDAARRLT